MVADASRDLDSRLAQVTGLIDYCATEEDYPRQSVLNFIFHIYKEIYQLSAYNDRLSLLGHHLPTLKALILFFPDLEESHRLELVYVIGKKCCICWIHVSSMNDGTWEKDWQESWTRFVLRWGVFHEALWPSPSRNSDYPLSAACGSQR